MECKIQRTCMFQKMGDAMVILQAFGIVLLSFCQSTRGSPCLHLQVILLVLLVLKVNFGELLLSSLEQNLPGVGTHWYCLHYF